MPQHGTPDAQGDALDQQPDTPDTPDDTQDPQPDTPDATPLPPQHG
jgi:hypothetical protein